MNPDRLLRLAVLIDFHFVAKDRSFKGLHRDYVAWITKAPLADILARRDKLCAELQARPE